MLTSSRSQHDALISAAIAELRRQGISNISADHVTNFSRPSTIGSYIPDVTGFQGNRLIIVEAESSEGLQQQHTRDQLTTFYRAAIRSNGAFILAVSVRDRVAATALLQEISPSMDGCAVWTF